MQQVPNDLRNQAPCYCSHSRGSLSIGGDSAYSEAHYAPTVAIRPHLCLPKGIPVTREENKDSGLNFPKGFINPYCPSHIYASTGGSMTIYHDGTQSRSVGLKLNIYQLNPYTVQCFVSLYFNIFA